MNIPQTLDPEIVKNRNKAHDEKVALIGCGPASISCATFLARLGYTNLTIYEKQDYIGGLRFVFKLKYKVIFLVPLKFPAIVYLIMPLISKFNWPEIWESK